MKTETVMKNFRLSKSVADSIETYAEKNRVSQKKALESAWYLFMKTEHGEMDIFAEIVSQKVIAAYRSTLMKIKAGTTAADFNTQVLIELFNTLLASLNITKAIPTDGETTPVLADVIEEVKGRISVAKQKADDEKSKKG
jgi:hypothetical protein